MIVIGLTGMSGAGKTTASDAFSKSGFAVINCDTAARKAVQNKHCLAEIEALINGTVNPDGTLNRRKTADAIFNDENLRKAYNKLIYPYISFIVLQELARFKAEKKAFVLLDAPTLFESGIDDICDKIVSVVADRKVLVKRIMQRDNISQEAANARLNSQHNEQYFRNKSDYCVNNIKSEQDLRNKINDIINDIFSDYREEK